MFRKALPVWAKNESEKQNDTLCFRTVCEDLSGCEIAVAAVTFYKLTVNGEFVSFGPARTATGYARVDRIPLKNVGTGKQAVEIEVAGYFCRSLSTCIAPSFLTAEITKDGEVLRATGSDFECFSTTRLCAVPRYSGQRHFCELRDLRLGEVKKEIKVGKAPEYLPRVAPYANTEILPDPICKCRGKSTEKAEYEIKYPERYYSFYDDSWGYFEEQEIVADPYVWLLSRALNRTETAPSLPLRLKAGEYAVFDFGESEAAFLRWDFDALSDAEVIVGWAELNDEGDFSFGNIHAKNAIGLFCPEKSVKGESFEPYVFRHVIVAVKEGEITLNGLGARNFVNPMTGVRENTLKDPELRKIYDAALRTFAHNAVDLYTDCPSRERAGWLCDSFFTGRTEYFLFGRVPVENAYLENFRLYRPTGELPEGVLPMSYPADVRLDGQFIPQWDLWYILECAEYLTERNPNADKEAFRGSIYGILGFVARYENADGLPEDLPSWNFVEWSTANQWTKNVNYPTAFLYAEALRAAGDLYGDTTLSEKGENVRKNAVKKAFDGKCFVDHALREDGVLKNRTDTSEAGQYYAFLFGGIDPDAPEYADLKRRILTQTVDPADGREFVPVNAFIGLYLRILTLMKWGERDVLKKDLKAFFGGMVATTNTLWEYKEHIGSQDHGFASLAALACVFAEEA